MRPLIKPEPVNRYFDAFERIGWKGVAGIWITHGEPCANGSPTCVGYFLLMDLSIQELQSDEDPLVIATFKETFNAHKDLRDADTCWMMSITMRFKEEDIPPEWERVFPYKIVAAGDA